jgi:BlaI family transcriptional regulator, penicillinase repressor
MDVPPKPKRQQQLTRLELQIMQVLWDIGPATVQAVQEKLAGGALAYTTVQTMLNVLQRKSRVKRRLCGKAYEYRPLLTREKAVREAIGDMVDRLFGGSAEALLMSLVKTRQLDPKKLANLKKALDEHVDRERGGEDHGRD